MQRLVNLWSILFVVVVVVSGSMLFSSVTAASAPGRKQHQQYQESAESFASAGVTPGIPIAIIFDTNTSYEIRDNIEKAIRNINSDIKFGRNKWAVKYITVDTSDNYELMQAVCQQMSRGVLAIFGTTSWSSVTTLNSFTSYYGVPFISWSHLVRSRMSNYKLLTDFSNMTRRFQRFNREMNEFSLAKELSSLESFRTARNFEMETDYDIVDYTNNDELLLESLEVDDGDGNVAERDKVPAQLYLRPDLSMAMIELISYYGWTNVYYIYNHEPAIVHLESLLDYQLKNSKFVRKILVRKIKNINNCRNMLRAIESSGDMNNVNEHENDKIIMIIDLDSKKSYLTFLNQVKDLGMTKTRYHYVLATLGIYELDLNDFRHGGVTITGFSIVDYYSINTIKVLSDMVQNGEPLNKIANIPHEAALVIDGLAFFTKRVNALIGSNMSRLFGMENVSLRRAEIYVGKNKGMNCSYSLSRSHPKWPLGGYLLDKLKSTENGTYYEGLTGFMGFSKDGRRRNFTIGIYKVGLNQALAKIGQYSSTLGLKVDAEKKNAVNTPKIEGLKNRKLVIVSIKDDPFLMFRNEAGKNFTGNDRFTGYCADLAKRLSEMLNFTYDFRLVKDNKFGARDNEGNWDGIVGELIRHEADIAVAPLTISSQRERVIEFSMPFMNIGISIMIKKPKKEKPGVFSFMEPLDSQIWLCVILAYISVTIIMFLVSRFSPYEWHYDEKKNAIGLNNDFNILNTLWFNLAAVMQQGVDLAPRSFSGRLVASVWWFFTMILISSYTANLAAFLTIERMVSPIESAEDLVKQSSIRYGTLEGGSTKEFFKNSRVPTYQRMWASMEAWKPSVFVKDNMEGFQRVRESKGKYAYLLESSLNEYLNERLPCDTMKVGNDLDSKGYGIATPIRSEWRDPINLAVLQLKEEGFLDSLKTKYWYDTSECGSSTGSSKDTSQSALNLINVAGIFYILIIGLILSVLVATLELMYKAKLQSEKNKIEFSEAVKSKMRLSISGYEDSIKDFRKKNGIAEEVNQLTPFPT